MDRSAPAEGRRSQLLRVLGAGFTLAVVVGGTIGVGILRVPAAAELAAELYSLVRLEDLAALRAWELQRPAALAELCRDLQRLHRRHHLRRLAGSALPR